MSKTQTEVKTSVKLSTQLLVLTTVLLAASGIAFAAMTVTTQVICPSVVGVGNVGGKCGCLYGGTYPTSCLSSPATTCPSGTYKSGTACVCSNGKTNPPTCTLPITCSSVGIYSATTQACVCSNSGTNYPTCTPPVTTCPSGTIRSGSSCVCANGATNPPTCVIATSGTVTGGTTTSVACPAGTRLSGTSCVCSNGMNNPPTCGAVTTTGTGTYSAPPGAPTNVVATVLPPVRNPDQCEKPFLDFKPEPDVWTCGDTYVNRTKYPQVKITFTPPNNLGSKTGGIGTTKFLVTQAFNGYSDPMNPAKGPTCIDCVNNPNLYSYANLAYSSYPSVNPFLIVSNPSTFDYSGKMSTSTFEPGVYYKFSVITTNNAGQSIPASAIPVRLLAPIGPTTPISLTPRTYANGYKAFANYFLATSSGVKIDILMPENKSGASPIKYTVIAEPTTPVDQGDKGRIIVTSAYSPVTFSTGFLPGIAYTFMATVNNGYGTSLASPKSVAITPIITSVSLAPNGIDVKPIIDGVELTPVTQGVDTGNLPIVSYRVKAYDSYKNLIKTIIATSSPVTIMGLTNGGTYSFSASIINALGEGDSTSTGSVTLPIYIPIESTDIFPVVTSIKESKELPGDPNACKNLKYFNDRIFKNNTKETLSFEVTGFVDDELLINGTIYEQNLPSYAYGKCNGAHTITPYKIDMKPGDKIMINTGDNHGSRAGMDLIVTVSKKINVKFDKTTSGNPKVIILPQYKDGTKNFQTYPGIIAAEIMNDNRSIPINIELNCLSVIDKTNKLSQTWTINNGSSIGSCFEDSSASICKRASSETVPPTGLIKELYVFNINNYPAETLNCNLSLKVDNNLKDTTGGLVLFGSTFINAFSGYGKYAGSLEQNSRIIINRTDPVLTKMYVPIRDLSSDAQNASNILGLGTSYVFKEGDKAGFASQVADVCNRTKLFDQIIEKKSLPATVSDDYYDLFVKASPVAMINASTTAMVKAIVDATLYKTLQGLITGPECSAR